MYFFSKGIVFVCKLPTWKLTFYMEKFIFQVLRWFIMIKNSIFLPNAINQNQFAWYNPWQIIIIWCRCVCKLLNFCPIVFNWISVQSDFYHVCIAISGIKKCLNYKIKKHIFRCLNGYSQNISPNISLISVLQLFQNMTINLKNNMCLNQW